MTDRRRRRRRPKLVPRAAAYFVRQLKTVSWVNISWIGWRLLIFLLRGPLTTNEITDWCNFLCITLYLCAACHCLIIVLYLSALTGSLGLNGISVLFLISTQFFQTPLFDILQNFAESLVNCNVVQWLYVCPFSLF